MLDSDIRVNVINVSHEVTQGPVVTALVRSPRERKLGLLQIKKFLNFIFIFREILDWLLCHSPQADKELDHVSFFILKHFIKLQWALVLVVGTAGRFFASF